MLRRQLLLLASMLVAAVTLVHSTVPHGRTLRVVPYPFIPEYKSVLFDIKRTFEALNPDIYLDITDLSSNYYSSTSANYIGNADADVYELDSVFLRDFVDSGKIQPLPAGALIPEPDLLRNAIAGSQVGGVRYGAAHWVCGNFLFFSPADANFSNAATLSDIERIIGSPSHSAGHGLVVDLKGKLTLGEFYLQSAFDRFKDWASVKAHLSSADPAIINDLSRLVRLCDQGYCRSQAYHEDQPSLYARQFARRHASALVGYSESLHEVLSETRQACTAADHCLSDADIDVIQLQTGDAGAAQVSWVDSFVMDKRCTGQCRDDASKFIEFMNSDATYRMILLSEGPAPAYLLPAKRSLYGDADVLKVAHLYPKLKGIIESAVAPYDSRLNESLRQLGSAIDSQLPVP